MTSPLSRVGAQAGFLTAPVPDPHLDTDPAFAQRQYTFRFDLVEAKTGATVRTLTPLQDSVPVLAHDTTRTIKRTLSLALDVADTAAVDTIRHRVRVKMVLPSGATYPLGRYMFTDNTRALYTSGTRSAPQLMDEMFILDNPRETAFPVRYPRASSDVFADYFNFNLTQNNVGLLLASLLAGFTTLDFRLEATPYITNNTWSFGSSSAQVLTDLALFGDYFDPWFGNDEQLHLIRSFDPANRVPDVDWDRYLHVYADTVTDADDLLTAANRFVVVSNNPAAGNQPPSNLSVTNAPVVGSYDVPATAPHSIYNRGFVVPDIRQLQVDTAAQAQAMATSIGITNTVYERQTMDTWADPRHDSYTVIRWQDDNWLELGWSMNLVAGGTMSHTIRKVYG